MNKLIIATAGLALIGASCSDSEPASVATTPVESAATAAAPAETTAAPAEEAPVDEAPAEEPASVQAHEFSIINDTRIEIYELYVSPATAAVWEDDLLGAEVLPDGESVDFTVDLDSGVPLWDLLIVDEEGNSIEFYGIDLLSTAAISLEFDQDTGEGTAVII